jgi:hypothetical protein
MQQLWRQRCEFSKGGKGIKRPEMFPTSCPEAYSGEILACHSTDGRLAERILQWDIGVTQHKRATPADRAF